MFTTSCYSDRGFRERGFHDRDSHDRDFQTLYKLYEGLLLLFLRE
jgi:hypothetical protein